MTDMDRAGGEQEAGSDPSKVPTYAPKDDEPTTHAERVEKDRPAYPSLYCAVWPDLVPIARSLGYALTIHGSLSRDLDLIAVPWTEEAVDAETLVRALADKFGAWVGAADLKMERVRKPHGRMCAILVLGGHAVVDLSVMPRASLSREARGEGRPEVGLTLNGKPLHPGDEFTIGGERFVFAPTPLYAHPPAPAGEGKAEGESLADAVRLDCQPKSQEDAVYVSAKWRDRILSIANGPS